VVSRFETLKLETEKAPFSRRTVTAGPAFEIPVKLASNAEAMMV
jgi:hypothetical protein